MKLETNKEHKLLSPEESELQHKLKELSELEKQMVDRELELATLKATLLAFECRYLSALGIKYARLDEIHAQISECVARKRLGDKATEENARDARNRAKTSSEYVQTEREHSKIDYFNPSKELKKLYRDIACRLHPDLADDDKDCERRNKFMADVNSAYQLGDVAALREILRQWENSPESVVGQGVAAELVRTIRKLAQVRDRISVLDREIALMTASDLYDLYQEVSAAEKRGRDLLAEIGVTLDAEIQKVEQYLSSLTAEAANNA